MNETKTLTLSQFLKARYREEEAAAQAVEPLKDISIMGGIVHTQTFNHSRVSFASEDGYPRTLSDPAASKHFALHDPAFVLEDIMSKRAIVDLHEPIENIHGRGECTACGIAGEFPVRWPCPTLRLLAAPHRHHHDYRGEWA